MFNNTSTPADDVAQIDMPDDGVIEQVVLAIACPDQAVAGEGSEVELTFGSTSNFIINDARTTIARVASIGSGAGTAANAIHAGYVCCAFDFPSGLRVFGGERIHMHTRAINGGQVTFASAIIILRFRKFTARRR